MSNISWILILEVLFFQSCASLRDSPKYQLQTGYYDFRQKETSYKKVFVEHQEDTLKIYSVSGAPPVAIVPSRDEFFRKRSFDLDVITIGFKFRPEEENLPRQLNVDFNGNLYLGYRVDRFQVHFNTTPAGLKKTMHHRAYTIGMFGGLGGTAVNPWTTNYQITDEYNGLVITQGVAVMAGLNNLTVGVGIGWDYLTDRDNEVWIYQGKPWLGLTLGLNIN